MIYIIITVVISRYWGFLDFVNSCFKASINSLFIPFIMLIWYLFNVILNVYLMSINY